MNKVTIDFETYCEADIGNEGAWKYSLHPSLDVLCLAYAINDGEVKIWRQYEGDELPYDLFDAIEDGYQVQAWNVSFEYSIWENWCLKQSWPEVPLNSWFDIMSKAATHSLPLGLMNACNALNLPDEFHKQEYGAEVLKKFSIPQKDGKRILPHLIPVSAKNLYKYCMMDVVAERHIDNLLADLVPFERDFWHVDFLINRRGIPVDTYASRIIRDRVAIEMKKANDRLPLLTNNLVDRVTQNLRIVKFCQASGIRIDNLQASTVDKVLDWVEAHPEKVQEKHKNALEVLTIRKWFGKSATSKYDKILDCADPDDKVKFTMVYHGAHTGRWAGRLIQPHNFFKSTIHKDCDIDAFIDAVCHRPIECVEAVYQPYIHAAASATRAMIAASGNETFYIGDYNAIEARMVFWMAGDSNGLNYYHQGLDPYCEMAARIFGRKITKEDAHERFIGKSIVLGAGFGLSGPGFVRSIKDMWGIDINPEIANAGITKYRETHPEVPRLWREIETAALSAVKNPNRTYTYRGLRLIKPERRDFLYIFLPSGRYITFPNPRIVLHKTSWGDIKPTLEFKVWDNKWIKSHTYGGRLTENVVQAAARDVMAYGIYECELAGYPVAFTVHDELIIQIPKEGAKEKQLKIREILQTSPSWAQGLPIVVEDKISTRYRK